MSALETPYSKAISGVLRRQAEVMANFLELGSRDIDHVLGITSGDMLKIYQSYYKRIYFLFGQIIFDIIEKNKSFSAFEIKGTMRESFYDSMMRWAQSQMGQKIGKVNATTKKKIAQIIEEGMIEGISNREIAKQILSWSEISSLARAMRIARTETHTVAMKSTQEAMQTTRMGYDKEWIAAGDDRTREEHYIADGEVVPKDEPFMATGEPLMFPGDPGGSDWNVINCRCIEVYNIR
jgi:SPP1 gp7 family putative phage head morphogenesis protein